MVCVCVCVCVFSLSDTMTASPVCFKEITFLSEHLIKRHLIKNEEKRRILLQFARSEIGIRSSPCPVPGCGHHKSHLQSHLLIGHRDLTVEERERWTQRARIKEASGCAAGHQPSRPLEDKVGRGAGRGAGT